VLVDLLDLLVKPEDVGENNAYLLWPRVSSNMLTLCSYLLDLLVKPEDVDENNAYLLWLDQSTQ
jgi:hypothetical protein